MNESAFEKIKEILRHTFRNKKYGVYRFMLDVEFIDYILFRSENYNLSIQNYEYCIVIRLYDMGYTDISVTVYNENEHNIVSVCNDIVDTAIKIHNKCCLRW